MFSVGGGAHDSHGRGRQGSSHAHAQAVGRADRDTRHSRQSNLSANVELRTSTSPTDNIPYLRRGYDEEKPAPREFESQPGFMHKDRFEYAQRTLSTITVAGTFMAGVEATLLSLIISVPDGPLRSVGLTFGAIALLSTSFAALYCAVAYIWLRQEWTRGPKQFHEWVAGASSMLIVWSSAVLVLGIYSGFFTLVLLLFAQAPKAVAVISSIAFVIFSLGPMTWGFYYWWGLYKGWLVWQPDEEGSGPRRAQTI